MAVARAHGDIFSPMHFSVDLTACWRMQQRELREEQLATSHTASETKERREQTAAAQWAYIWGNGG